jgi:hypothetical protein
VIVRAISTYVELSALVIGTLKSTTSLDQPLNRLRGTSIGFPAVDFPVEHPYPVHAVQRVMRRDVWPIAQPYGRK